MKTDWQPLIAELTAYRAAALTLRIWWRDDDATRSGPRLRKLGRMSRRTGVPVHLAVVPARLEPSLVRFCARRPYAIPLVHGYAHENRAPEGQKKSEFGQPHPDSAERAHEGLKILRNSFGEQLVPIFVPPWNRVAPETVQALPALGFTGLSTFTPRSQRLAAPGLVQINTHLDPIDWRNGGGLIAPETLIAQTVHQLQDRRQGRADPAEPFGLLTHHIVHDRAIWRFAEDFLKHMLDGGALPCDLSRERETLP